MKKLKQIFSDSVVLIATIIMIATTLTCLYFFSPSQTNSSVAANNYFKENFALYLIYVFMPVIIFMALPLFLSLGETFKNLSSRFTNYESILKKVSYSFLGFSIFYSLHLSLALFYSLVKLSGGDLNLSKIQKLLTVVGLLTIIIHSFIAGKNIKKNLFIIYTMYLALYTVLFSWVFFYHIKGRYIDNNPLLVILVLLPFCGAIIYFAQRKLDLWAKIPIYSGIIFWLSIAITNLRVTGFEILNKTAMPVSVCAVFVYLLICYLHQKKKKQKLHASPLVEPEQDIH